MEIESNEPKKLFNQLLGQPSQLPQRLIDFFQQQQERVLAYALLDLDQSFQLVENWLVLTEINLYFMNSMDVEAVTSLSDIKSFDVIEGANLNRLTVSGNDQQKVVMGAGFSNRQLKSVNLIKYMLEESSHEFSDESFQSADEIYQKNLLSNIDFTSSSKSQSETDVVWRLLKLLKPYKKEVSLGLVAAVTFTLLALIPAYLTGYLIDKVVKPFQSGELSKDMAYQLFYYAVAGLFITKVLMEFSAWVRLKTMSIMGEKVARDLRDRVYSHLHKLSLSYFSSKSTGSLISRVSSDTDRIWDFIAFGVVQVITSVIMLLGLSAVLLSLDWKLGLLVSLPVPIFLWMIVLHGERMRSLFLRCWRRWSGITDCISDTIPGIRVVKAFNKESHEVDRFVARNKLAYDEFVQVHEEWTRFWPVLMMSINVIIIGVWFFGVPRMLDHVEAFNQFGDAGLTVGLSPGTFVSFVIYMTMFVHPIEIIGQMARMVNRATSSAYRVFEVLDAEPQIVESRDSIVLQDLKGEVEFDNVSFSYDGVRKVLNQVSFKVKPGEMIGLVGPSGSGKTTITNLITRFYDVTAGEIKIDGVSLNKLNLGCLREQIGMVLQEPYLFHGSLVENIKYGCPEARLDKIVQASRAANAHEFIMKLPNGYDTIVGERGHTLSGGERQRISIARAILRNPKLLILDEATSAVDTETEKKIQQALDRLVKGRTVFAIAHRLSTLAKADRVFVVKNGELVEQGTHEELLGKQQGVYKGLVDMQTDLARVKG